MIPQREFFRMWIKVNQVVDVGDIVLTRTDFNLQGTALSRVFRPDERTDVVTLLFHPFKDTRKCAVVHLR